MGLTVCFIGHRYIDDTPELREKLKETLYELLESGANDFIFGDHSAFNDLCYEEVTALKEQYPQIRRLKFRTNYEDTNDYTMQFLLAGFEDNICPKGISAAGKAAYAERNQAMIRESDICVFYYNESYQPEQRKESKRSIGTYQPKSGTKIAYDYAVKQKKKIINLYG